MRYLFVLICLAFVIFTDTSCRKKTDTSAIDSFFVHYWRIDSAKTTLIESKSQSYILSSISKSDPAFKSVTTYKSTNVTPATYLIITENLDNTYSISPYFNYSNGKLTTNSSSFKKYEGKYYYSSGLCQFQEFLTVQKF